MECVLLSLPYTIQIQASMSSYSLDKLARGIAVGVPPENMDHVLCFDLALALSADSFLKAVHVGFHIHLDLLQEAALELLHVHLHM